MFGPPGLLYVYFTYGMHFCMNVVTGDEGRGSAVLLRAAEPIDGIAAMRRRRPGARNDRQLLAGPARLTQALAIDRALDGTDLVRGSEAWIERGTPVPTADVGVTGRVGLSVAREQPWRFVDATSAHLSRPYAPASARPVRARPVTPQKVARR
jgi:DNA-3-methyladenine glycosylase